MRSLTGNNACQRTGTATTTYGTRTSPIIAFTTTFTDESTLVARTTYTDGLGRLEQAVQNSSETTTYSYDALDNLTGVSQPSVNGRSFGYSSLSRLVNATNPESGLSCYSYDPDGNLSSRTLGASSCSPVTGGIGLIGQAGDVLGLGLSFSQKLAIDAGFAGAEAAYCYAVTK